jgi:hypothetical protein
MKFDVTDFLEQFPGKEMRNCITAAAVLLAASFEAERRGGLSEDALRRWEHARKTALFYLNMMARCAGDLRDGPDLASVKLRACRECGCTEQSACEGGCYWVDEDLCSKCAHANYPAAGHA